MELQTESSFQYRDLAALEDNDASELAHALLSDVEHALISAGD